MSTNNAKSSDNNMQVSVQHPTLTEIISRDLEGKKDAVEDNILKKPVRLSVFLKELEEAENEPIPDIEYTSNNNDEVDNKDEELSEFDEADVYREDDVELSEDTEHFSFKEDEQQSKNFSNSIVNFNTNWLVTPAKQPYFTNFLTPNVSNLNRLNIKGSFTQLQDRNGFKAQYERIKGKNQSADAISLMPTPSSTKRALLFPIKKHDNKVNEYHHNGSIQENQDKENVHRVLCSVPVERTIPESFENIIVNNVEYVILNQIGRGGSSVVFHCYDPVEKCERAIKRVNLTGDKACIDGYINEVKMLFKLQKCDRIIKMYSYEIRKSDKVLLMVLEKGQKDLDKILKELSNNTEHLPMYMLIYYWMEMLYAVRQIHKNGIIHSDLKPANFIMVSSKLKLIDFGIASSLQSDMTSVVKNVQIGSFNYISPEALINNSKENETANFKINFKSDVWSLGCILYQLIYRRTPFQHIGHTYAKLSAIIDPKHEIVYADLDWVPSNVLKTLRSCLQYDVKLRPSVSDLITNFENMYY